MEFAYRQTMLVEFEIQDTNFDTKNNGNKLNLEIKLLICNKKENFA